MILVINICKEQLSTFEFVKPIEGILTQAGANFKTKHYKQISEQDVKKADKIIICGTSLADNEFLKDIKEFFWIKYYKKPILAICGGSHIIGLLLGYKLKKNTQIGLKEINLEREFLGIKGKLQVYHLHQFNILPDVFKKDNIYCVLFHPEVRNKNMIENFVKMNNKSVLNY